MFVRQVLFLMVLNAFSVKLLLIQQSTVMEMPVSAKTPFYGTQIPLSVNAAQIACLSRLELQQQLALVVTGSLELHRLVKQTSLLAFVWVAFRGTA